MLLVGVGGVFFFVGGGWVGGGGVGGLVVVGWWGCGVAGWCAGWCAGWGEPAQVPRPGGVHILITVPVYFHSFWCCLLCVVVWSLSVVLGGRRVLHSLWISLWIAGVVGGLDGGSLLLYGA